ncbi:hypothetical protein VTP01DRAFT_2809 [Rhizomucor pusillus]|uniref:uncharacterized protein n=1 Tax=Rhizomucor pusillus TaxID=4840 RepID=UPI00374326B8
MSNNLLSVKENQVLASQREIDWLERQIDRLQTALESSPLAEPPSTSGDDAQEIRDQIQARKEAIDDMRTQLEVTTQFNLSKESMLRVIDSSFHTLKSLYPEESDHDTMERHRRIREQIEVRDDIVVSIMQLLRSLRKTKNHLAQVQTKVIEHHQENRQLMKAIEEAKQQALDELTDADITDTTTQGSQGGTERIHELQDRFEIARNVLIGLILESNINWIESEWLEVMLRAGDEMDQ